MAHRFKKPKFCPGTCAISKRGGKLAQMRRYASRIISQEQLDAVLASVEPELGRQWLELVQRDLKFKPRQLQKAEETSQSA